MNATHELPGELCLVAVGEGLLDGEDDAVGDDGEEHGVLEGWPLDQELMGACTYDVCTERGGAQKKRTKKGREIWY